MIRNDLYCPSCDASQPDAWFRVDDLPFCACGVRMRQDWSHGHPPATDLHPTPQRYGETIMASSHRDAVAQMRAQAQRYNDTPEAQQARIQWKTDTLDIRGDKHHGARDETRPTGAAFGYAGQQSHTSTGERKNRNAA